MKQKYTLTIDKPCTETFGSFQKTDQGGFCGTCQKEVIDFTKMSDQEIIAYFQNRKGNTCGRFHQEQLKSYFPTSSVSRKRRFNWLGAGLMSVSLFSFLPIAVKAQLQKQATYVKQTDAIEQEKELAENNETDFLVQGIVVDEEGELPGVVVVLKGSTTGVYTDIDGKFSFPKRLKAGDILVFSYVGYEIQEFVVTNDVDKNLHISMKLDYDDFDIMGEVAVNEPYSSKRSLWQKIKAWFTWKK